MYQFLHEINWCDLEEKILSCTTSSQRKSTFSRALASKHPKFLEVIYPILGSIKPIKNSSGKYSASETFAAIPDIIETPYYKFTKDEFRCFFSFLNNVPPSNWVMGLVGSSPEFCALTPLVLKAFKDQYNIMYEEWDFEDPAMKFMMNSSLYDIVQYRNTDFSNIDLNGLREDVTFVSKTGEVKAATAYPTGKGIQITEDIKVKSNSPLALMLSQCWVAHTSKRKDYMVLDPNDWDRIPKALDVVVEDVEPKKKKEHEKMPF